MERYEVFTTDVQQSITTIARDMRCDGIVLVTSGEHTRLMQDEELKHLLIRLTASVGLAPVPSLRAKFFSWWRGLRGRQKDGIFQAQDAPVVEKPLWIRTEQHHLG